MEQYPGNLGVRLSEPGALASGWRENLLQRTTPHVFPSPRVQSGCTTALLAGLGLGGAPWKQVS